MFGLLFEPVNQLLLSAGEAALKGLGAVVDFVVDRTQRVRRKHRGLEPEPERPSVLD